MVRVLASGEVVPDDDPRAQALLKSGQPKDLIQLYVLPKFGLSSSSSSSSTTASSAGAGTNGGGGGARLGRLTHDQTQQAATVSGRASAAGGAKANVSSLWSTSDGSSNVSGGLLSSGSVLLVYFFFYAMLLFLSWLGGEGINAGLKKLFGGTTGGSSEVPPPGLAATLAGAGLPPNVDINATGGREQHTSSGTEQFCRLMLGFTVFYDLQDRILFFHLWKKGSPSRGASSEDSSFGAATSVGRRVNDSGPSAHAITDTAADLFRSCKLVLLLLLIYFAFSLLVFADSPSAVLASGVLYGVYKLALFSMNSITVKLSGTRADGINAYFTNYWLSVCGAILLYGYDSADRCDLMVLLGQAPDPLCVVKGDATRALICSFLLRLLTSAHFIQELQSKINQREYWIDAISRIPAFTPHATTLMNLITLFLQVGLVTLVFGSLACDTVFPQVISSPQTLATVKTLVPSYFCFALVQYPATFMFEGGSFGTHLEVQSCGFSLMAGVALIWCTA
eukprot:g10088.t1